jgi:tetratricopeptide (TPR) repeat protein
LLKLGQSEKILFGSVHKSLPSQERVGAMEVELFGEHHQGSLHSRVEAIQSALASGKTNLLMPPMAPELDRGGSVSQGAPPPAAPAIASRGFDEQYDGQLPQTASPDRAKLLLRQALQLYSIGQISEAEAAFKRVLSIDKHNVDAYFNLGAIAEGRGDLNAALGYYRAALKANPTDPELKNAVTAVQTKLADASTRQSANAQLERQAQTSEVEQKRRDSLKGRINDASTAYKKGNYDEAIGTLNSVAREAPNEPDVQYALSQCYKAKHQYMEARSAIKVALALDPNNQLYKDAVNDLDRRISSGDTSVHSRSSGYDTLASDSSKGNSSNTNAPVGQITPFSGIDSNTTGWQSAGRSGGYTASGGYLPGFARRSYGGSYLTTTRIERVAIGTVSGAAIGALFGGGYRGRGRSMLVGGAIGGLFGLLSGR